jgi:SAM-dependent methyltransferase
MDTFGAWPSVMAYKSRTAELVGSVRPAIDVGCGVGDDVRALGKGGIGVDPSELMLAEAAPRGGRFVRGSIDALPFASSSAGAVRTDRVLQHVDEPLRAIDEMTRVLRPGGAVVCAEPDQSTLTIAGTDDELTPDIVRFRADRGIRNGTLAGDLASVLGERGYSNIVTESFPIAITDPSLALGMPTWPSRLVELGWWTVAQAERFSASIDPAHFCYQFDIVVTTGTR